MVSGSSHARTPVDSGGAASAVAVRVSGSAVEMRTRANAARARFMVASEAAHSPPVRAEGEVPFPTEPARAAARRERARYTPRRRASP